MSDDHARRRCTSCSAALAVDNRAGLCAPCAKAVQAAPDIPPVLPADYWEQSEIRSALLSRHLGRFLRAYRTTQSPQITQAQLARWLGTTQGHDDVHRRDLLKVAGSAAATAGGGLLAEQAEEYVPGSSAPATRSWIAARTAEELGRLGDETAALRALERAFTAFDFARPRTERVWTGFFTANRLGSLTVSTYIALAHRDAIDVADSLLASLSPTNNKARAIALADLTTLAVRTKDFDRANTLVGDAIDVTVRTGTSIARQRLLTLASTLTTTSGRSATGALRDQIVSSLRR